MRTHRIVLLVMAMVWLSGCSVVAAINQPAKKDLSVLEVGTYRDAVRAELGAPISSEKDYDVFRFQPGATAWKYPRAFLYAAMDIFSLGLAELITYPVEKGAITDDDRKIRVHYDEALKVTRHEDLRGGNNGTKR